MEMEEHAYKVLREERVIYTGNRFKKYLCLFLGVFLGLVLSYPTVNIVSTLSSALYDRRVSMANSRRDSQTEHLMTWPSTNYSSVPTISTVSNPVSTQSISCIITLETTTLSCGKQWEDLVPLPSTSIHKP